MCRTDAFAILTLHFESHVVCISTENYGNFKWSTHYTQNVCDSFILKASMEHLKEWKLRDILHIWLSSAQKLCSKWTLKLLSLRPFKFSYIFLFCSSMSMTFVGFHFPYLGTFCVTNNSIPCNVFFRFEYGTVFRSFSLGKQKKNIVHNPLSLNALAWWIFSVGMCQLFYENPSLIEWATVCGFPIRNAVTFSGDAACNAAITLAVRTLNTIYSLCSQLISLFIPKF